jgi:hypothetical protein
VSGGRGGGRGAVRGAREEGRACVRACVLACVRACTRRLTCPLVPNVNCSTGGRCPPCLPQIPDPTHGPMGLPKHGTAVRAVGGTAAGLGVHVSGQHVLVGCGVGRNAVLNSVHSRPGQGARERAAIPSRGFALFA